MENLLILGVPKLGTLQYSTLKNIMNLSNCDLQRLIYLLIRQDFFLTKQSQKSRSVLWDGYIFLMLFQPYKMDQIEEKNELKAEVDKTDIWDILEWNHPPPHPIL